MIAHVVLFRPRAGLPAAERDAFERALAHARQSIPSIRRFAIGRRVLHGARYEQAMTADFPFAAIVEFDDLGGMKAYLAHPAHDELGRLLWQTSDSVLVYDYEVAD